MAWSGATLWPLPGRTRPFGAVKSPAAASAARDLADRLRDCDPGAVEAWIVAALRAGA